ncbi:L-threonine aldolase [Bacillus sp. OV322]|uniref:threonine aldolase family protein n=1 Tax=Bacillus sp. OV322 TaxID=1882764 RepID=UPI0008E6274C|nr:aminotransferase class I/II-fold pyridoxal phosphate-dependent enzyme [Bacillus sp. OV322]SFC95178.1 L-threonine aldolase [Bacillus sp. OV322]
MKESLSLRETFNNSSYLFGGHGNRDAGVLKDAFQDIEATLDSDIYGKGKVIEDFQDKMAALLGKEAAVFFPSGTMAQQIALRIWCDEKGIKKVAYHPLSHLEIHEQDGLKKLHSIETVLLADKTRVIELEDIVSMEDEVSSVLLELPQREIGGQLPSFETLEKISAFCQEKKIRLHLDGARLLEVLPYYGKSAAEVCALFDSVYMSFYKGIGGIAGAILAGSESFIEESKVWKRRYGGDLISLYPYIISSDYYFNQRFEKMPLYYEQAMVLAGHFNSCEHISTLPEVPVSNMFHVYFQLPAEQAEKVLAELQQETGIGITSYLNSSGENSCYFEMSLGDSFEDIPKEKITEAFGLLKEKVKTATLSQ